MGLRRVFLLAVAVVCAAVLVLAAAGVWGKRTVSSLPEPAGHVRPDYAVCDKPIIEREGWVLKAERAYVGLKGTAVLVRPSIEAEEKSEKDPARIRYITVTADRGEQKTLREVEALLQGNVRVEVRDPDWRATLVTDTLYYNGETRQGKTDSAVTLTALEAGGEDVISGQGVEFDLRAHRVRIAREVRLALNRNEPIISSPSVTPDAAQTTEKTRVRIACQGEMVADRGADRITLHDQVVVTQGQARLMADRLDVDFKSADAGGAQAVVIRKVTAEGHVELVDASTRGACGRLVRDVTDGLVTLYGTPECTFTHGRTTLVARRIEFREQDGVLLAPGPGRLVIVNTQTNNGSPPPPPDGQPLLAQVSWQGQMRFDLRQHRASFDKAVVVKQQGKRLTCELLIIDFDSLNEKVTAFHAEGGARLTGEDGEQAEAEAIVLRPVQNTLTLKGRPLARLHRKQQQIECGRIEIHQADRSIHCTGKGRMSVSPGKGQDKAQPIAVSWVKRMSYEGQSRRAVFEGEVECTDLAIRGQATARLRADRIELVLTSENEPAHVLTEGRVRLVQEPAAGAAAEGAGSEARIGEAAGDRLTWDMKRGQGVLEGAPVARLSQKEHVIECARIEILQGGTSFRCVGPGRLTARPKREKDSAGEATPVTVSWARGMSYDGDARRAVFEGAVDCAGIPLEKRGLARLRADRIDLTLTPDNAPAHLSAEGHVRIGKAPSPAAQPKALAAKSRVPQASGDQLTLDMTKGEGWLVGRPVRLMAAGRWMTGEKITFSEQFKKVKITGSGRVKAGLPAP